MGINFIKKYLDNLLIAVEKKIKEEDPDTEFKFVRMFLETEEYKNKMIKDYQKKKFKFIIVSADKFSQKVKSGEIYKTQTYKITIATENKSQDEGFNEVTNLANQLIDFFTSKPLAIEKRDGYSYHVNLDSIIGQLNLELTTGDYWIYELYVTLDLPL